MAAIPLMEHHQYSIEEYLQLLEESTEKLEYQNGQIHAMSGGTINHGKLCNNIGTILNNEAKGSSCIAYGSEVKVRIEKSNSFVFPDAMLICNGIKTSEQDQYTVTNPVLIVEVLSKQTEAEDRGDKFHKYCSLPSFKEYILINQYKAVVDILYKAEPKYWKMSSAIGLEKEFYIHTLDLTVSMQDLYDGTQHLEDFPFG